MISVILYGRNDSHGYNLHKRSAISLNCIAEMLTDADDEIIFVDYNTPNDLPTFIEAIYDTLTPKAKLLLRVLRVRPELHARLVGPTHLAALEPHSRNIGIRRSNPRNRWVLFTNTDMIFLTADGVADLPDAVRDLAGGQYIVPRFELPEPLWESFPRSDPQAVMRACAEFGPRLHLNEVSHTFPYMLFDQPGDFQLVPRQALFDIHGFDQRMIFGWHSDSNMCKRLNLYFGGRTESLAHRIRGYHCDHTRVATLAHRADIKLENNLQEFVYGVEDPVAPHQAETWGVPDEPVEELEFTKDPQARFCYALERTLRAPQTADYHSDANELRNFVFYQPEHVLPHLAGNLTVYPRDARFAYVGNNPRMRELTARCVSELGFTHPPACIDPRQAKTSEKGGAGVFACPAPPADLLANYDLLIFDFGLDLAGRDPATITRVTDWPREQRYSLGQVARTMEACAIESDARWKSRAHIPDFIVVNANHYVFRQFVGQFLLATDTPFHTRVRKGRPRVGDERLYRSHAWKETEDVLRSLFGYDAQDLTPAQIGPGHVIDLTSAGQSAHYKDGHWGAMDASGVWIEGNRASLLFAPPAESDETLIAYVRVDEAFTGPDEEPFRIQVSLEGELLTRWTVYSGFKPTMCKVRLPPRLMRGKSVCRLELFVENPLSAQRVADAAGRKLIGLDPRELSIKIHGITFAKLDRLACSLNETVSFTETGEGARYMNEAWTPPDNLGAWTVGPVAGIQLYLANPVETSVTAVFAINDAGIGAEHPNVEVAVDVNGKTVANWKIGTRSDEERRAIFPPGMLAGREPVCISLRLDSPGPQRRSVLGIRVKSLRLEPLSPAKYKIGDVIDFADVGNGSPFLVEAMGAQWTTPDRFGCWTIGPEATMSIPFEKPPSSSLPATFIVNDCNVGEGAPKIHVGVKANGHAVAEWEFGPGRDSHKLTVDLPAEAVKGSRELALAFEIRDARSAASLGWTTDPRLLGIRITRAVIGSRELAFPMFDPAPSAPRGAAARARSLVGFALHTARVLMKRLA